MPNPIVLKGFISQNNGSAAARGVSVKQLGVMIDAQTNPTFFKNGQGNAALSGQNIDPTLAAVWPEGTPVKITIELDASPPPAAGN